MFEKRYFKVFASTQKREKNYMKLFESIDRQEDYNEKEILQHFAKEKFVNNFSVAKAYLYNLILRSLQVYHTNISADLKLSNLLQQTKILYEKALYPQCIKLLTKAKKIAYKYEKHLQILEIHQWELQMQKVEFNIKKLDEILAEEKKMLLVNKNSVSI